MVLLLPFILIFMLLLINDKKIMGEHVNSRFFNIIAGTTIAILIGLSTALVLTSFLPT